MAEELNDDRRAAALQRAGVPQDQAFAASLGYALAEDDINLLLWLHAEAVWTLKQHEAADLSDHRLEEALNHAGRMSEARRRGDATTDRLREFAHRLLRLDDPTDVTGVEDRRTMTLNAIIGAARSALDDTSGYVTEAEASRQAWAEEAMRMDHIAERMALAAGMNDDRLRFAASRYLADGSGLNFRDTRCTGVSSDALAWFAVGRRDEPKLSEYPLDPSDLAACERTYEMAPEFLRERMEPVLARYRAAVAKDYPEVGSGPQCAVHPEGGTT